MKKTTIGILLVALLGAAFIWYFNARKPVEPHPSVIDLPVPSVTKEPPAYPLEPVQEPPEPEALPEPEPDPLPALEESDDAVRAALSALLGADAVSEWLMTEQFINRIVAFTDSLPSRQVAPLIMPVRPPGGKFLVVGEEDNFGISPDNAVRYQAYIDLAGMVDTDAMVGLYQRYYPLFQQAYEALGYPGAYFNDRLVEVIDHLLATPEPVEPPVLVKPEAVYLYADEALEALSAGQKMLLRAGAEHRQTVRSRLREFRAELTRNAAD
jgi:hypothetical protein